MTRTYAVLDRPEIQKIVFHPRREAAPRPDRPGARTVRMKMDDGTVVAGRLYPATVTAPLVLFFHGNGEIASDYDDLGSVYNRFGISLLVMDYRGYGSSEGFPSASRLIADARTIWRDLGGVLKSQQLKPERVFVMGRSLGSAAALEAAGLAGTHLAGLIIESGFGETFSVFGRGGGPLFEGVDEQRDGFGNLDKIAHITAPTLIIHGEVDQLIEVSHGEALFTHSPAAKKRLVIIPGAGHNNVLTVGAKPYFDAIREFVAQ